MFDEWLKDPVKFIEEVYGIKLYLYQKIIIGCMNKFIIQKKRRNKNVFL